MSQSGRGRREPRRMGGLYVPGSEGYCLCPNCGYRVVHCPGLPCANRRCPKCGIRMLRE